MCAFQLERDKTTQFHTPSFVCLLTTSLSFGMFKYLLAVLYTLNRMQLYQQPRTRNCGQPRLSTLLRSLPFQSLCSVKEDEKKKASDFCRQFFLPDPFLLLAQSHCFQNVEEQIACNPFLFDLCSVREEKRKKNFRSDIGQCILTVMVIA